MDDTLKTIYTNPSDEGSFSSIVNLQRRAQQEYGRRIPSPSIRAWTSGRKSYTLHKKVVRKFKRRKTIARGIGHQYQADLIQFDSLSRYNSNYNYILVCIDVFSRKAFAEAIKRKTGPDVAAALENIFRKSSVIPALLQVDFGKEFFNQHVRQVLDRYGVKMFAVNSEKKASIVERLILTLKRRLFRWMTENNTKRYLDVLDDIIHAYNHYVHRSIGMKPVDVSAENESELWQKQYGNEFPLRVTFRYNLGDRVRIAKHKKTFEKSYLPQWSDEYFFVSRRRATRPPTYKLKSAEGRELVQSFYEEQLQSVRRPELDGLYPVDIIKSQPGQNGRLRHFVHYRNYPPVFDRWLDSAHVTHIP